MTGKIDVHNHYLTPRYLREMANAGITDVDGFPLPPFDAAATLAVMDRNGITAALLSVSSPAVCFTQGADAAALARAMNESCAEMIAAHPGRFGGFAVLPLPAIDAALREIAYALDVLRLDGVSLLTNYHGVYPATPAFRPIFAELDRRRAVIFFHPTQPPGFAALGQNLPAPMLEYPFETTRMIAGLIGAGILRDFTQMRLIVAHGGGVIPYLAHRMAPLLAGFARTDPGLTVPDVIRQLKTLYYDLTATAAPAALAALARFVPAGHLLYGTDFPFMPEVSIAPAQRLMQSDDIFTDAERRMFHETNAAGLFPRLA